MRTSRTGVSVPSPTGVLMTSPEMQPARPVASTWTARSIQPAGQRGGRVDLQQRAPGQVRGRPARRVGGNPR